MTTVPVSVLIPAHNADKFIAKAIASVLAQTVRVAELIVVANDCSDQTAEISSRLGATVITEPRRGLSIARNAGLRASTQEWVAFLDADDWWATEKIERQWRALREFPDAALISCDNFFVRGGTISEVHTDVLENRWNDFSERMIRGEYGIFIPNIPGDIMMRFCPKSPTTLFRRDVLSTVGYFNEDLRYNDELEFFMRVMARYALLVVELPLVYCRLHDQNRSRDVEGKQAAYIQIINLMLKHPERYPPGAGEVHRQEIKHMFHNVERAIRQHRNSS
jgi:glycosyltransferase involved in cell wall biosynthesis